MAHASAKRSPSKSVNRAAKSVKRVAAKVKRAKAATPLRSAASHVAKKMPKASSRKTSQRNMSSLQHLKNNEIMLAIKTEMKPILSALDELIKRMSGKTSTAKARISKKAKLFLA